MKTNLTLIALAILAIGVISCGPSKHVHTGNRLYAIKTEAIFIDTVIKEKKIQLPIGFKDKLIVYENNKRTKASFEEKTNYLSFSKLPTDFAQIKELDIPLEDLKDYTAFKTFGIAEGTSITNKPFYAYPKLADYVMNRRGEPVNDKRGNPKMLKRGFRYYDGKPVVQAVSITLKFRPAPNLSFPENYSSPRQAAIDSFPSQVESGVSFGLALGYKFNYNWYKVEKDLLGRNTNQISLAPAILLGTGITDISNSNTRFAPKITSRKAALITTGLMIMAGFNNINVGYATGWDWAQGSYADKWIFQGKRWNGIVVALDILK